MLLKNKSRMKHKDLSGPSAEPASASTAAPTIIAVRNFSLIVLTVLAVIYTLHWAREIFIPVMLGVMISYALSPLVNLAQRWHIPRALSAAVFLLAIVGTVGSLVYSLSDEAATLIETLPQAAKKFRQTLSSDSKTSEGTIDKVKKAATQIERAANESTPATPPPSGVTRVQIEKPKIDIKEYLWIGTLGAAGAAAQVGIVLFLTYFLLVSGNSFRRKLVKISGPTLNNKKITLQVLDDINDQIQRYMLVQVFTSSLVGVATWLAFSWIGVEQAAIWGVAAGVLNTIPYLGPVLVSGGSALVAFLQFGTFEMALLVGGVSLTITSLEGYLLTPWLTGRASRMSAVVVFISVLAWGWLWGVWGLLLGVPIIMIIKSVCDRIEDLKPVGELLGD